MKTQIIELAKRSVSYVRRRPRRAALAVSGAVLLVLPHADAGHVGAVVEFAVRFLSVVLLGGEN